jgi:hypothetical protein
MEVVPEPVLPLNITSMKGLKKPSAKSEKSVASKVQRIYKANLPL